MNEGMKEEEEEEHIYPLFFSLSNVRSGLRGGAEREGDGFVVRMSATTAHTAEGRHRNRVSDTHLLYKQQTQMNSSMNLNNIQGTTAEEHM